MDTLPLGRRESSSLGLTDCGSEDDYSIVTAPSSLLSPELGLVHQYLDPEPFIEGATQPFDDAGGSPFSGYLLLQQCNMLNPNMDSNSFLDLQQQSAQNSSPSRMPDYVVDNPVTSFPGPANMFDGVPAQDS